jgi:hypothetical protein
MTTVTPRSAAAPTNQCVTRLTAAPSPPKYSDRTGVNEKAADLIPKFVGWMWMLDPSLSGFKIWIAGPGVTASGEHYPFNLMLLAVGEIERDAMVGRQGDRAGLSRRRWALTLARSSCAPIATSGPPSSASAPNTRLAHRLPARRRRVALRCRAATPRDDLGHNHS